MVVWPVFEWSVRACTSVKEGRLMPCGCRDWGLPWWWCADRYVERAAVEAVMVGLHCVCLDGELLFFFFFCELFAEVQAQERLSISE